VALGHRAGVAGSHLLPPARAAKGHRQQGKRHRSTLDEWQQRVTHTGVNPATVLYAMKDLAHVDTAEVALRRKEALRSAVQLLRFGCDIRAMRKATFIDAIAKSLEAHPALLDGTRSFRNMRALVAATFGDVAQDAHTYSDAISTAQLATAQATLKQYCAASGASWSGAACQVHARRQWPSSCTACTLAVELGAPPPSNALWARLEEAMQRTAADMDGQGVSNCLYACAKLKHVPGEAVRDALLAAVPAVRGGMVAQNVSNTLWAPATLGLACEGDLRGALLSAAVRTRGRMNEQDVANTLWSLAKLEVPLEGELREALLAAAVRESGDMTAQDVASTLLALAQLEVPVQGALRAALLSAAVRESDNMNAQAVSMTLVGIGRLHLEPSSDVRDAMCAAIVRAAPFTAQGESMVRTACQQLQWEVSTEMVLTLQRRE
jgi:hypothetical protein